MPAVLYACLTPSACAAQQVPPLPSHLARILMDLLWASCELREVLSTDVTPELWQVLLNHAQPDWVVPSGNHGARLSGPSAGPGTPWLPQLSSAGQLLSPFTSGSVGGDSGLNQAGSGGGVSDGACSANGVPVQVFSMIQCYGEWYVQVRA